jgi:hypothetical protein
MTSAIALVAFAAAQAAAPHASGPKWVPLQQAQGATTYPNLVVQTPVPAAPAMVTRYLPAGTLVNLTPIEEITSKHLQEGTRYDFIVVNDVTDGGVLVIPRGSKATGVITMQTGRAVGGKSGKFDVSFESVTANGITFPLSGVHRQEGKGNTLGALFGSLIISGRSAVMLPGDIVTAFTKIPTAYSIPASAVPVQAVAPVAATAAPVQAGAPVPAAVTPVAATPN